jgi:hypothetical protein
MTPSLAARLLRLRPRDVLLLARAQWAVVRARMIVRARAVGSLATPAAGDDDTRVARSRAAWPPREARAEALRLAEAVRKVATHGPVQANCLARSVALQRLLRDAGIERGVLRVGVRRDAGAFEAHAWLELDGRVVGDEQANTERYSPFERLHVRSS